MTRGETSIKKAAVKTIFQNIIQKAKRAAQYAPIALTQFK